MDKLITVREGGHFLFKLTVELKQQTPLIHFQPYKKGEKIAILRGTDLKPRIDRFLGKYSEEIGMGYAKSTNELKDYKSLDYRVFVHPTICDCIKERDPVIKNGRPVTLKSGSPKMEPAFPAFFANMGQSNETKKFFLLSQATVKVEFSSTHQDLLHKMREIIPSFFVVNNFGTRSNKGFGSFKVISIKDSFGNYLVPTPAESLAKINKEYYKITFTKDDYKPILKDIWEIYKLMKSGLNYSFKGNKEYEEYERSFLFRYMHKKNIGNEKKFIKQNFYGNGFPDLKKPGDERNLLHDTKASNMRYVRAVLGTAPSAEFKVRNEKYGKILYSSSKIKRFPSPIIFKVISNEVYILLDDFFGKYDEILKGHEFSFTDEKTGRICNLKIPTNSEFDIKDFLREYIDYLMKIKTGERKTQLSNIQIMLQNRVHEIR